ncbi:MAG: glycine--tRNA ligase subunit beta [Rhodospirillales bacterium]|nr:glycine--tRNA ligase subunit beta [Rhodospirillales bacterium]
MAELLLEILSEEIPAGMQNRAAEDLRRLICAALKTAGLTHSQAAVYSTPRRITLVIDGLPVSQPDIKEEKKGPSVNAPEQALQGFLKGNGLASIDQAEIRELPKGKFYFAVTDKKGQATAEVLRTLLPAAMVALPWPKSMRWGNESQRWVRPIHLIVCLFDKAVVPFAFAGVTTGNQTRGHRFLSDGPIAVDGFAAYAEKLRAAQVLIDPAARRQLIEDGALRLAAAEGLTLKDDPGLLDEVTGLVEWPVVHMGSIDDAFMDVPQEALISSMRKHQKYFSCLDADGRLATRFVVVANTETPDNGAQVIAGNERVLRARLSDAKFFWDQDRKTSLAAKAPALKDRVFHAKLGTLDEKIDRVQALAAGIASAVTGADKDRVRSAARLAKADLSSGMVAEFPDLQGIIGRYYALHDGESPEVADAIAEHYSPVGPNDMCPTKPVSVCVALADKIDTLVGFFAIDEKPTGSKDPYALRRAALGIIRLIIENNLRLSLLGLFEKSHHLYGIGENPGRDLLAFFADRLKVHLKDQGVRHDHMDAVFALGGEDDLVRLIARVAALSGFLATDDGENLLTAYRRAANILRIEEKKDGCSYGFPPDASLYQTDEENALSAGLQAESDVIARAVETENFAAAMQSLAKLRGPVDAFFENVTVNADDAAVRENRLKLLSRISSALDGVADFSKIDG